MGKQCLTRKSLDGPVNREARYLKEYDHFAK